MTLRAFEIVISDSFRPALSGFISKLCLETRERIDDPTTDPDLVLNLKEYEGWASSLVTKLAGASEVVLLDTVDLETIRKDVLPDMFIAATETFRSLVDSNAAKQDLLDVLADMLALHEFRGRLDRICDYEIFDPAFVGDAGLRSQT